VTVDLGALNKKLSSRKTDLVLGGRGFVMFVFVKTSADIADLKNAIIGLRCFVYTKNATSFRTIQS